MTIDRGLRLTIKLDVYDESLSCVWWVLSLHVQRSQPITANTLLLQPIKSQIKNTRDLTRARFPAHGTGRRSRCFASSSDLFITLFAFVVIGQLGLFWFWVNWQQMTHTSPQLARQEVSWGSWVRHFQSHYTCIQSDRGRRGCCGCHLDSLTERQIRKWNACVWQFWPQISLFAMVKNGH